MDTEGCRGKKEEKKVMGSSLLSSHGLGCLCVCVGVVDE